MYNWHTIRRRLLPKTLFGRSLMIIMTPMLLLQMIVAFVFFDRHWDTMTEHLVTALAGEVQYVTRELSAAKTAEDANNVAAAATASFDIRVTAGNEIPDSTPPFTLSRSLVWQGIGNKLVEALARKIDQPFTVTGHNLNGWFEVRVRLSPGRMARFVIMDKRLTTPTTYIFIIWMIASATVLLLIAIAFMRNQIRPIRRLAVAAEKFGKGQEVPQFKLEGAKEVRQASRAFIEMKDRLKRQIEQRTAMLAGVSHDLRTPLTRMKLQLAMAKDSAETANLRQDIDEMEKMIEGYLTFAKGDGDELAEMTDLRTVLERIVANARRQGHDVEENLSGGRMMLGLRPMAVERALSNVVTNACKFAKHVWISAYEQTGAFEITVDDDGPGIPEDERDAVFRPFYRVEKSRNKKTGGIGLGLSIARDVIHSHGGEIFLEPSNRGGLRVVIRLPF